MRRILTASAELLEEVGVDGFNTNLLAKRAGLGVRAIYRYFPNKLAILVALSEDVRAAEQAWIGDLRNADPETDWRAVTHAAIEGYFQSASRHPGYAALRAAALATPELREMDRIANTQLESDLAAGLRGLGLKLEEAHLSALCRTVMESANRMLDIALMSPPQEAELLVRELKLMLVSLLQNYFDPPS